jgi:hypothetical protein
MTLQKYIDGLSKEKQFNLAIKLARLTLPLWDKYAGKSKLTYRDSVVGLTHFIKKNLLKDTIELVEKCLHISNVRSTGDWGKLINIHKQFIEPIVALQDGDWELPGEALKTFYAIYNLLEALKEKEQQSFGGSLIFISINQSIDLLDSSNTLSFEEINDILNKVND